jgi:hypothetical protein
VHTNNIIVPEQFSFRKELSTENAAFKPTNKLLKVIIKMHVGGRLCHLAKDFDCINQEILLPNYIFMTFKELLQTGLHPILQTENKKWKQNHPVQIQISSPAWEQ